MLVSSLYANRCEELEARRLLTSNGSIEPASALQSSLPRSEQHANMLLLTPKLLFMLKQFLVEADVLHWSVFRVQPLSRAEKGCDSGSPTELNGFRSVNDTPKSESRAPSYLYCSASGASPPAGITL